MAAKLGIRVKHSAALMTWCNARSQVAVRTRLPEGWYLFVRVDSQWKALLPLRFLREWDAKRAAKSLTDAGLDSHWAMLKAGGQRVKEVACADLQW